MKIRLNLILIFFLSVVYGYSQPQAYKEFENIDHSGISVTCLFQDEHELIWVCTQGGMYAYNGVKLQRNYGCSSDNLMERSLRCSHKVDSTRYFIGTESGLYLLDLKTYSFELLPETAGVDVRAIAPIETDVLLLGTMNGLVSLDLKGKTVRKVNEVYSYPVVSISLDKEEGRAYISSNNGFFEYSLPGKTYTFIPLPLRAEKSSLIHAMNFDKVHRSIWLGAGKKLYQYNLDKKVFEYKPAAYEFTINTITVDSSGYIWVGTDNGVRTYNAATGQQESIIQSSRSNKYVVWTIFEDCKRDIWLGTDSGLYLYRNNSATQVFHWNNLAQSDEENQLTALYKDSRRNFWFGGTNGLGRLAPGSSCLDWYKAEDSPFPIVHNRIRCFYEDRDGDLWVGTNESINRFDYRTGHFIHYSIMDSTLTRSTDWSHSIMGDEEGFLWISSFLGGVFKVNKEKLIKQEGHIYLAEENYYQHAGKRGLSSNRVQTTIRDKRGNIWASTNGYGLNKIDIEEDSVVLFSSGQPDRQLSNNAISSLFCDKDGFVWVGLFRSLDRINPRTNEVFPFHHEVLNGDILSIEEKGDYLWLVVSNGLYALNKQNQGLTFMKLDDSRFLCSFLDKECGRMYIGGFNHCISFDPDRIIKENKECQPVIFSSLFINNKPIRVGEEYDGNKILLHSLPYTNEIVLTHNQNNVSFEITDIRYNWILKSQYQYKLDPVDKNLQVLDMNTNRISYHNLLPGKYTLIVQQTDETGHPIAVRRLVVRILSPWYATVFAKGVYLILFLGFLAWIINYFRVKNNLRLERVEKEKSLELSAMKMEFLSDISHELKTPLSLIISPSNQLFATVKNSNDRKLVQTIQQNAMRLSALVNRMIDIRNLELSEDSLSLSWLEIVEFAQSILNVHQGEFRTKGVELTFETNVNELHIHADVLKLESILNNLLSNAYKFSQIGDTVFLKLDYQNTADHQLIITVTDTGIGIPPKDIPYIFNRFYQSDANAYMNKDGSGIGLSMVKKYVELHHGTVKAASEVQKGTSITSTLPVNVEPEVTMTSDVEGKKTVNPAVGLKVLVVEDNIDIARFIAEHLKDVHCQVAHNGSSGLEMALNWHPDIILSDVMMPVMGGIEMTRLLKQNIETAAIPIILLTAKSDKKTENQAYSAGVEAFIPKPFDIKQLVTRIDQIKRNKSLLVSKIRQSHILEEKEWVVESQDEKLLAKITQFIEDHLADSDLSVQKLSDLSGINTKQIYRRIKLLTGHTVVDYIKSIRLKKAAMLLSQQKFSVGEVMYMVGFSNPSYFSKCFTEKYGMTPKQYMESATQ